MTKGIEGSTLDRSSAGNRVSAGLQTTAEHFRMLVENMKDYAIIILDADGRVASWNPGSETILGYRSSEIIGQHLEATGHESEGARMRETHHHKICPFPIG